MLLACPTATRDHRGQVAWKDKRQDFREKGPGSGPSPEQRWVYLGKTTCQWCLGQPDSSLGHWREGDTGPQSRGIILYRVRERRDGEGEILMVQGGRLDGVTWRGWRFPQQAGAPGTESLETGVFVDGRGEAEGS